MKKIIFASVLTFALLSAGSLPAQNKGECKKAKTECPAGKKDCCKKDCCKKDCPMDKKACCKKECPKK